jgi:hypothetical protein
MKSAEIYRPKFFQRVRETWSRLLRSLAPRYPDNICDPTNKGVDGFTKLMLDKLLRYGFLCNSPRVEIFDIADVFGGSVEVEECLSDAGFHKLPS